jgi:hypothetical protein
MGRARRQPPAKMNALGCSRVGEFSTGSSALGQRQSVVTGCWLRLEVTATVRPTQIPNVDAALAGFRAGALGADFSR